jgi:hypothetical protein
MPSGNFACRPASANPVRPRVSPPKSGASRATACETGLAKRRHASVWAMGRRPRTLSSARRPRGLHDLKATTPPARLRGGTRLRRGGRPGHRRRGGPRHLGGPRLSSPHPGVAAHRCPVTAARPVGGRTCRRPHEGPRTSAGIEGGRGPGAPAPRPTGAGSRRAAYARRRRGTGGHAAPVELRRPVSGCTAGGHQAPGLDIGAQVTRTFAGRGARATRPRRTGPRAGTLDRWASPGARLSPPACRGGGGEGWRHAGAGWASPGGHPAGPAGAAAGDAVPPPADPTGPHATGSGHDTADGDCGLRGHRGPRRRAPPGTEQTPGRGAGERRGRPRVLLGQLGSP